MQPRMRIGLRASLLLVAGLGVWLALWANRARDQAAALRGIAQNGGRASFDDERGNARPRGARRIAPAWLRHRLGEDSFRSAEEVRFADASPPRPMPPEGLRHQARLPGLRRLQVRGGVDDRHLAEIGRMPGLEDLELGGPGVTDAGFAHLAGLGRLEALILAESSVTDAGLAHLRRLARLEELHLPGAATVEGPGPAYLAVLPRLRHLDLNETGVGDEDLHRLAAFPSLRGLTLGERVTDAGLHRVVRLAGLEELHLINSPVTDAGIDLVLRRTRLAKLSLHDTHVSPARIERIAREHPSVRFQTSW